MIIHPHLTTMLALLSVLLTGGARKAAAQGDDFNDGDAVGWTELTPLAALGVVGGTSFPNGNSYRLQSAASTNEEDFGPARIGSIREDVTYTDFYQFVDLVDHDQALDQNIGMLARITNAGLGTTDGYGVTYNPSEQKMYLTVITGEEGINLLDGDVFISAGDPVRLVFRGEGAVLKFEIYSLEDLATPVASLEVSDSTWASGTSGVFVTADESDPAIPVDCTFDNYFAAAEEPSGSGVTSISIESDDLVFEFLSHPNQIYSLWESDDLSAWNEVEDSIPAALDSTTRFSLSMPAVLRRYYQFRGVD